MDEKKFEIFEGIRYRFDMIEMSQSLKFVGVTEKPNEENFDNIERYHQEYIMLVNDKYDLIQKYAFGTV